MKKAINNFSTLIVGLSLIACFGHSAAIAGVLEKQQRLEQSLRHWQLAKKQHKNNYQYSVSFSSWVGFAYRTTLIVQDGVVVKRAYENFDQTGKQVSSWQENSVEQVGTHKQGAAPKTLDQLYRQCSVDILTQGEQFNDISLSFDKENILSECTYTPKNCADDCSFGVRVEELTYLKSNEALH